MSDAALGFGDGLSDGGRGLRLGSRLNLEGSTELVIEFTGGDRMSDAALGFGDGLSDGGIRNSD